MRPSWQLLLLVVCVVAVFVAVSLFGEPAAGRQLRFVPDTSGAPIETEVP